MNKVLVTGAAGFVGKATCQKLSTTGHFVRKVIRGNCLNEGKDNDAVSLSINASTNWANSLKDIDTVIHLAARVHVMNDAEDDPLKTFRDINTTGTIQLAKAAATAGVQRFIFLSSIKVNGDFTVDKPFNEVMLPDPQGPYAISKHEAELGLLKIAMESPMEIVIIRPPLVYGPGVKANFLRLLRMVVRGVPLPFGAISNKRSMIALDNLVDVLITCIDHPAAANEIFLVSDGSDLSTAELTQCIARQTKYAARLFFIPLSFIKCCAIVFGKEDIANRLTQSLQIDSSKVKELLEWQPPVTVEQGVAKTVEWFLQKQINRRS